MIPIPYLKYLYLKTRVPYIIMIDTLNNNEIYALISRADLESRFVSDILYEKQEDKRLGVPLISYQDSRKFIDSVTLALIKLDPKQVVLYFVTVGEWPPMMQLVKDEINQNALSQLETYLFRFLDTYLRRFLVCSEARLNILDGTHSAPELYKQLCANFCDNGVKAVTEQLMQLEKISQNEDVSTKSKNIVESVTELHRTIEFLSSESNISKESLKSFHYYTPKEILTQATEQSDIPCFQDPTLDNEFFSKASVIDYLLNTSSQSGYLDSPLHVDKPEKDQFYTIINETSSKLDISEDDKRILSYAGLCLAIEKRDLYRTIATLQRQISLLEKGIIISHAKSKKVFEDINETYKETESILKKAKKAALDISTENEEELKLLSSPFSGDHDFCCYEKNSHIFHYRRTLELCREFQDDHKVRKILLRSLYFWSDTLSHKERNLHPKGQYVARQIKSGAITPVKTYPQGTVLDCHFEKIESCFWKGPEFRLVVNGKDQIKGVDYHKTDVPIPSHLLLRLFFALAQGLDHNISQFEFPDAIEQGDLEEEIYIELPYGSDIEYAKLNKCLSGLKQAKYCWTKKLNSMLEKFGFKRSSVEKSFYILKDESHLTMLIVHFDNILVSSSDPQGLDRVRGMFMLDGKMYIRDLGFPKTFFGIDLVKMGGKIGMSAKAQIEKLVLYYTDKSPPDLQNLLSNSNPSDLMFSEVLPYYRTLVKKLKQISKIWRPDITAEVSILDTNVFEDKPKENFDRLKKLIEHLSATISHQLVFSKPKDDIISPTGYVGTYVLPEKQHLSNFCRTGYILQVFDNPVLWLSQKEKETAYSNIEGEFIACSTFLAHIKNFQILLKDELHLLENAPIEIALTNKRTVSYLNKRDEYEPEYLCSKTKYLDAITLLEQMGIEVIFSHPSYTMASAFTQKLAYNSELSQTLKNLHVEEIKNSKHLVKLNN